jgi:DNA-binding NtrC family response regulator
MGKILIVDDEPNMRRILAANLKLDNHKIFEAAGVAEARRLIAETEFDAVITDQKMPDGSGLDVLAAVREQTPNPSVVFLTAVATLELAVESMRSGAFDFLAKPFTPDAVRAATLRACERSQLLRENSVLKDQIGRLEGASHIVGESSAIEQVRQMIARVAPTSATVLITGETGTGKELVARAIHKASPRARKSFLAVNCAAFSETLLESELFGHERGAFTGAETSRQGLFEAASGGTLLLDEIGEMSMTAQAKLLRVLTEGEVTRLGSTKPREVDVRVLAATHRDLPQRVREGLFREDLYYRLAVIPVHVPPLRERMADLPLLCEVFLLQVCQEMKIARKQLSAGAQALLGEYAFPGNIRELRNLIERACILSVGSEIGPEYFFLGDQARISTALAETFAPAASEDLDLRAMLAETEKRFIEKMLAEANGVQAEAARRLGLSRSDLSYKLSKYSIKAPKP